jgi:hypothetical protein
MNKRQLSMAIMGLFLISVITFFACNKYTSHSALTDNQTLIKNAQDYFATTVLPGKATSPSGDPISTLTKTPRWDRATVQNFHNIKAVVVPIVFNKPLTFKFDGEQTIVSAAVITKMIVYPDGAQKMHCEVAIQLADDSYIEDTTTKRAFTGRIRLEDWYGDFIRTMHFTKGKNDKNYLSTSVITRTATTNKELSLQTNTEEMDCTITDWYTCSYTVPDDGSGVECDLYSETEDCQPVDPSIGDGGYTDYEDVYTSAGGDGSGTGLDWVVGSEDDNGSFTTALLCNNQFNFTSLNGSYNTTLLGLNAWFEVLNDPLMSFRISFTASCLSLPARYGNAETVTQIFVNSWNAAVKQVGQDIENGEYNNFQAQSKAKQYTLQLLAIEAPGAIWTTGTYCGGAIQTTTTNYCNL